MDRVHCLALVLLACWSLTPELASKEPAKQTVRIRLVKLVPLPGNLPEAVRKVLYPRWEHLDAWRSGIKENVKKINDLPPVRKGSPEAAVRLRDLNKLASEADDCSAKIEPFNAEVERARVEASHLQWLAAMRAGVVRVLTDKTCPWPDSVSQFLLNDGLSWQEPPADSTELNRTGSLDVHKSQKSDTPGRSAANMAAAYDPVTRTVVIKSGFRAFDPAGQRELLSFEMGKLLWDRLSPAQQEDFRVRFSDKIAAAELNRLPHVPGVVEGNTNAMFGYAYTRLLFYPDKLPQELRASWKETPPHAVLSSSGRCP